MSDLPAGRELDALIAERVMGWKVIETDDCNGEDNFWLSKDGQHPFEGEYGDDLELPAYSTSIADAWKVVEKMRAARTWDFSVSWHQGYDTAFGVDGWECEINGWDDTRYERVATSDIQKTAPHAICLAALRASEGGG